MEVKLAKIATAIVSGSYLAAGLLILLLFGLSAIALGRIEVVTNPFMAKVFFISGLYIVSVVLLATLPGKSVKRRAISWVYSIVFHSGFILYLAVFYEFGAVTLIFGIVETTILILSLLGLWTLLRGKKVPQA